MSVESASQTIVHPGADQGLRRRASDTWTAFRDVFGYALRNYRIPSEVEAEARNHFAQAFDEFGSLGETLKGTANAVFLIHARNAPGNTSIGDDYLNDAARCERIFASEWGIPYPELDLMWNLLPPRRIGEIHGTVADKDVKCALVSVPVTPIRIYGGRNEDGIRYARGRAFEAVELARKFGAEVVGLGETFASLTDHGKVLQKEFPDLKSVTGHAFTTAYIIRWVAEAARLRGRPLSETVIMMNGANGSICTAAREILLEENKIGGLILHDVPKFRGSLQLKAQAIEERYPELRAKVIVSAGDEELKGACNNAQLIVSAVSASNPVILAHHVGPDTDIIDDSQPPSTLRQSDYPFGTRVFWVLGKLPEGFNNTFDYGLVEPGVTDFTCALETVGGVVYPNDLETVDKVTAAKVIAARELNEKMGFGLAIPQNYGRPVSET